MKPNTYKIKEPKIMNAEDFIKSIGKLDKRNNKIKPISAKELKSVVNWLENELKKLKD